MKIDIPYGAGIDTVELSDGTIEQIILPNTVETADEMETLRGAIFKPLGSPGLEAFLENRNNILLVVNDATRPTPTGKVLEIIHPVLKGRNFKVIIATGSHRAPTEEEYDFIFGSFYGEIKDRIHVHDAKKSECYSLAALAAGASEVKVVFFELERPWSTQYTYGRADLDRLRESVSGSSSAWLKWATRRARATTVSSARPVRGSAGCVQSPGLRAVPLGELAAGGLDVGPALCPHRCLYPRGREAGCNLGHARIDRTACAGSLHRVDRDQIHVAHPPPRECDECCDLGRRVVLSTDDGILERRAPAGPLGVVDECGLQVLESPAPDPGHDPIARLLHCRVERHRERELLGLACEPLDARDYATRGDREVSGADPRALLGVHQPQRGERGVVVVERLALTHGDGVRCTHLEVLGNERYLPDHLTREQVADEPAPAGGAEGTSHRTPRLGAETHREAVAGGDADALDENAIGEAPEVFPRAVGRVLHLGECGVAERVPHAEFSPQCCRQVAHVLEAGGQPPVEPRDQLAAPERRLPELRDRVGELLETERSDVGPV